MSFIVPGVHKPRACYRWKNMERVSCIFLDDNDDCRLQKNTKNLDWEQQYERCPIIPFHWRHGDIVDIEKPDRVILPAEDDTWSKRRK